MPSTEGLHLTQSREGYRMHGSEAAKLKSLIPVISPGLCKIDEIQTHVHQEHRQAHGTPSRKRGRKVKTSQQLVEGETKCSNPRYFQQPSSPALFSREHRVCIENQVSNRDCVPWCKSSSTWEMVAAWIWKVRVCEGQERGSGVEEYVWARMLDKHQSGWRRRHKLT